LKSSKPWGWRFWGHKTAADVRAECRELAEAEAARRAAGGRPVLDPDVWVKGVMPPPAFDPADMDGTYDGA
jgi:hypothetical protein